MKAKRPNPGKFNELEFVDRLLTGDEAAYAKLKNEFFSRFTFFAEKEFGINPEDAKDLAQEVMISIFLKIDLYNPSQGKFVQWAFQILRNRCVDWLRKRENLSYTHLTDSIASLVAEEEIQTSPDDLSPLEKLPHEVRQAILRLSGRYQQFIGLMLLGISENQIMEILQIKTHQAFRSLKSRVFSKLRAEIHRSK